MSASQPPGAWVENWLSPERFQPYLVAAGSNRTLALELYEWNAQLSSSLMRDLAHIEVGIRNVYDRAITSHRPGRVHWVYETDEVFPRLPERRRGRDIDANLPAREMVAKAISQAGGTRAPSGKVIAELTFGFWRNMTTAAREQSIWVKYLKDSFPGSSRMALDGPMNRLRDVRNKTAHHEPLLRVDVAGRQRDITALAEKISPELSRYIAATSTVSTVLAQKPMASRHIPQSVQAATSQDWLNAAAPQAPALPGVPGHHQGRSGPGAPPTQGPTQRPRQS